MTRFFENTKKYRTAFCLLLLLVACMAAVPSMAKYTEKDISAGGFDLVISQNRQVFAVYGEVVDAHGVSVGAALNFYNRAMPAVGDTITLDDGFVQTVTEIYTGFDTAVYNVGLGGLGYGGNVNDAPWHTKLVRSATVVDEGIAPKSTNGWFYFLDTSNSNFYIDYHLTSIDISKLDTSHVTSMKGMFRNCLRLTSLDVSNLNTSNVVNMSGMFYNCNQLLELDISGMDTSSVTDMSRMFASCQMLQKVYVSEGWSTQSVTTGGNLFNSATQFIGGAGTTSSVGGLSYARIDGGTAAPGYFTYYRYSVVFEANGGTGAPPMMLSNENATENTFTIPQETPVGETAFLGWATTPDADAAEYLPGDTFTNSTAYPCCDVLYAVWEKPAPKGATTPEELEEDINDDGIADIGGGDWTFGLWDGVLDNVSTLTINDGTFDGSMKLCDAEFTINGGTINIGFFWCSASNVTINGGTFTDPGVQFYSDSATFDLEINGGTFAGVPNITAGNVVIRGGTFGSDPTAYADENCTVIDNGNGTWTVQ